MFGAAQRLVEIGFAVAGSAAPVGPVFGLVRAVGRTRSKDPTGFARRLFVEVEEWCARSERVRRLGGLPRDWGQHLVARSESAGWGSLATPDEAIDVLAEVVFVPLIESDKLRTEWREVAAEIAAELPEMVLRAGDEFGLFAALRALLDSRLRDLEAAVAALGMSRDPAAERLVVAGYLSGLMAELDRDPWTYFAGAARASLSSIQRALLIVATDDDGYTGAPGLNSKAVDADQLVGDCDRLVVLGGPGDGKTWLARRVAIRAAQAALTALNDQTPLSEVEIPLFARCSTVLEKTDAPLCVNLS